MGGAAAVPWEEISIRRIHGKFTGNIFKCQMGSSEDVSIRRIHGKLELAHGRKPVFVILVGYTSTNYRTPGRTPLYLAVRQSDGKGFQVSDCGLSDSSVTWRTFS